MPRWCLCPVEYGSLDGLIFSIIGAFYFREKTSTPSTTTNNSHDVLAALQLMPMLQLEDFVITGEYYQVTDTQMNIIKTASLPWPGSLPIGLTRCFVALSLIFFWPSWCLLTGTCLLLKLPSLLLPSKLPKMSCRQSRTTS